MNDDENSKSSNAFEAIMSTNQRKILKEKKTIIKPKDKKKTKQVQMNDFIKANKFYDEFSNMSLPSQIDQPGYQDSNKFSVMDEEEEEAKQESNVDVVDYQGYSNIALDPSPNSGLEPNLDVNQNTIQYWYYTLGKSFREYQYDIVKTCLSNNTLVALPTGLGKTFIAATVILNYYLWFPKGKIFFLAPTRPLVNQQMECLSQFELINKNDIFEMTGNYPIPKRKDVYLKKRIFFCTPQTLENDLDEQRYDGYNLSLVIFDEAHRGTGKYAYVNIVTHFESLGYGYRILALSATPGNEFEQIQDVLRNLRISKLEVKDDEDPDIKQYIHSKQIIPVKIQGNDLMTKIMSYLDNLLYSRFNYFKNLQMIPMQHYKLIKKPSDIQRGTSFQIMEFLKQNQNDIIEKHHTIGLSDAYDQIQTFSQLIHGKKLIQEQGMNCFKDWLYQFEKDINNKKGKPLRSKAQIFKMQEFTDLKKVMKMDSYVPKKVKPKKKKSVQNSRQQQQQYEDDGYENDNAPIQQNKKSSTGDTENGEDVELSEDLESHPKSEKLVELLTNYFLEDESIKNKSKTIIFTQSRNSASELKKLLNNIDVLNPKGDKLIRSEIFIGQANQDGQGMNQKAQLETIRLFKENQYNTLIATCIGEEGLDIGEVDLIVCYDSGFSPIRMIQRMGRTGRKRAGKVYILLMEGKEYANYIQSQKKHKELMMLLKNNSCHQNGGDIQQKGRSGRQPKATKRTFEFYGYNPRMIPQDINPICRMIKSKNNDFTPAVNSQPGSEEEEFLGFQGSKQNIQKKSNQLQKKKDILQLQVEEEEEEEEFQFKVERKKDLEDIYCYDIEEIDFEPEQIAIKPQLEKPSKSLEKIQKEQEIEDTIDCNDMEEIDLDQFTMKPQFERPKKSLEKAQKEQQTKERLAELTDIINGRKQKQPVKQLPPQQSYQIQQKLMSTPETMTPFSNFSSNEKMMRNSSNTNKKQTSVFDTNIKRSSSSQNQIRKSDPKQITKVPLKSNSKKNRLIISDSENMENDDFNRISDNSELCLNYKQQQYACKLDFNSNKNIPYIDKINQHHSLEKQNDEEIVFLKKLNPLHVFGNIEQEKIGVMKKRSNSKSSSDFNLNEYSLLYQNEEQSNVSDIDNLLKQIDQNSQKAQNQQPTQVQKYNFNQFEEDEDDDDDDEDDAQKVLEMIKNSKNLSQNTTNNNQYIQESKQEKPFTQNKPQKLFAEDNLFAQNSKQNQQNKQPQQQLQNVFQQNKQSQVQQYQINNQTQNLFQGQQKNNGNVINNSYNIYLNNQQIQNIQKQNTIQGNQQISNSSNNQTQLKGIVTQNIKQNFESSKPLHQNHLPSNAVNLSKIIDENQIDNDDEDDDDDDDDIDFLKKIASNKTSVQQSVSNNQLTNPSNSFKIVEKMEIEQVYPSKPSSLQTNKPEFKIENQSNKPLDQKSSQINNILSKVYDSDSDTDTDSDDDNVEDLKKLMSLNIFSKNSNFQTNNNQTNAKVQLDSVSYSSLNLTNTQNNQKIQTTQSNLFKNNSQISNCLIEKTPQADNFKNNFFNNQKPINNQIKQNVELNNQKQIQPLQNNGMNNIQAGISNDNQKIISAQKVANNQAQLQPLNNQNNKQNLEQNKNNNNNILTNFSGIKNVIQDKTKQVIQVNNQNIIVSNTQNQIKESNQMTSPANKQPQKNNNDQSQNKQYPLVNKIQVANNMKNELKKSESDSQMKKTENSQEQQIQRKTACDIHLEQIRKKMNEDFDIEEYNQRNKNKVVEQPKLDPKKARKAKKENQKKTEQNINTEIKENTNTEVKENAVVDEKSQNFKSVQQIAEYREKQNIEQNNQINKTSNENIQNQCQSSQNTTNPFINKENQSNQPVQQGIKQDLLNNFQDLLSCIYDSDEDDNSASKQGSNKQNLQNESSNQEQQKIKRENPFLNNPNSTYNAVLVEKKQIPKQ